MTQARRDTIFARFSASEFVGRSDEVRRLMAHRESTEQNGLVLLSQPLAGTSELLRQVYDRCFNEGGPVIPFYFEMRDSDKTAPAAARRFVYEFLLQAVAFRRRDSGIINTAAGLDGLTRLAPPEDGHWVDRLAEIATDELALPSSIRSCIGAPVIAASYGAPSLVLIDDVHIGARLDGGADLLRHIESVLPRSSVRFVLAGRRRFMHGRSRFPSIAVESHASADAGRLIELFASESGVALNDQSRDLITILSSGRSGHISSLVDAAASAGGDLDSFDNVARVYTDEIFGGRIARYYGDILERVAAGAVEQTSIVKLLKETLDTEGHSVSADYWHKHLKTVGPRLTAVLDELNYEELITADTASVTVDAADLALNDYIKGRSLLEIDGSTRARAVGTMLSASIKRGPQLMARSYRRSSAIGLRELLARFDGRSVSSAVIDYGRFRSGLKGADEETVQHAISDDNDLIALPHIIYTADTAAFYPKFAQLCDPERSAVAVGFTDRSRKDEITWLAAEIESKLEADRGLAEFWCDRLEMVAANCGYEQFRIWLVAPEGFSDDALAMLAEREAYGSSRKQAELLGGIFDADLGAAAVLAVPVNEYEIVIPMGHDTEMIAAHTVEEIAKRHGFPEKAVNQIKTALVEACINASEHSLSPDRRIHQRFQVAADRITITVSNRGVRLVDKAPDSSGESTRRGWGLKLIKGLMDQVEIESTDDGTRLIMVKNLPAGAA